MRNRRSHLSTLCLMASLILSGIGLPGGDSSKDDVFTLGILGPHLICVDYCRRLYPDNKPRTGRSQSLSEDHRGRVRSLSFTN